MAETGMVIPNERSSANLLARLAAHDERFIQTHLGIRLDGTELQAIDARTCALVRVGALVAMDATAPAYACTVGQALVAGATVDQIVGVTLVMAPIAGAARVVSAAPALGLAISYDVDAALERRDD